MCSPPSRAPRGGGFDLARPDGFRLDAVKHLPIEFWARFNADFKDRLLLGEMLDGDPSAVSRTWRDGGFNAMFDFPLAFAITDVFCRGQSPAKLGSALTNDRRYPDPSRLVTLVDNHDLSRVMSQCKGDPAKVRDALSFLFTARGVPSMSWGTEVGLEGDKEPDNRASMRFDNAHPLRSHVAGLLQARSSHVSLHEGVPRVVSADDQHVVIARFTPGEVSLVCVNHGPARRVDAPGGSLECPQGFSSAVRTGDFAAATAAADKQWRTASKRQQVTITGPAGTRVVGSGIEFGDWRPDRALGLPATLALPADGVFEVKLVRPGPDGRTEWAPGENVVLFVREGLSSLAVPWR